jgi:hypothetical protein
MVSKIMWLPDPRITAEDQAPAVAAVWVGLRTWQTGPVTSPLTLSRLPWMWFTAWLLVGAGYALSLIGVASIGLFVLPLPVLATVLLVRRQPAACGLSGLISGLGIPLLYVAYVNRAGPGTICTAVTGGQECNDEWSPWPWLAVGVILVVLSESPRSSVGSDEPACGAKAPRMNSVMERWIGSCRRELLDRTLIWNQRHLMTVLREYEDFYNTHRPHRTLNQAAPLRPLPDGVTDLDHFRVRRRDRAEGVIHEYRLVA